MRLGKRTHCVTGHRRRLAAGSHDVRFPRLAALLAVVLGGCLHATRVTPAPPESIRLTQVSCYVVCDSVTAELRPDGAAIRGERGAVIGNARERVPRKGADTVRTDAAGLDSLRAALTDLAARALAVEYRQGYPPCSEIMTTHTPVVTIEWAERDGPRRLRYDLGCHEPSGRLDAVADLAVRVARLHDLPVTPR